jgi:hypothetical protein
LPTLGLALLAWAPAAHADPTTAECVQLNEGAAPLQKAGKVIEAHANLVRCSASTCPAVVRDDCVRAAVQAEAAIPTLVLEVRDSGGNDLTRVHVTVDGSGLTDKLEGTPLEVDPGAHVFRFEAEGYTPVERRLVMHAAEKNRLERVEMVSTTAPPPKPKEPPAPPAHASALRPVGVAVGAVGIAGLAVGGVFGWLAHTTWNRAVNECGGGCPEGAPARGLSSTAHTDGTISTASFAAGGVLTAAGLLMFLVAPSGGPSASTKGLNWSPVVGPGFAGVSARWAVP